jgi:hypothetical protein
VIGLYLLAGRNELILDTAPEFAFIRFNANPLSGRPLFAEIRNAGGRTAIPPNGDGTAAVYREKSTLSTVEPAAIEIAFADAMLAVSG